MSECIVRMEMPLGCLKCDVGQRTKSGIRCPIASKRHGFSCVTGVGNVGLPHYCPIICALPENHGRLVDVDQLIHETHLELVEISMNGLKGTPAYADDLRMMCKRLADEDIAPTIVPATEGGKE